MDPKTYFITASADIIKKRAKFLEEKGFEFYSEDEYSIVYRNYEKNIQISVFFERYSDTQSGINISFGFPPKYRKSFYVWVFDVVNRYHNNDFFDYRKVLKTKLDHVMRDFDFLENHFEECMDLNYCEKLDREYNFECICEKYFSKMGYKYVKIPVSTGKE